MKLAPTKRVVTEEMVDKMAELARKGYTLEEIGKELADKRFGPIEKSIVGRNLKKRKIFTASASRNAEELSLKTIASEVKGMSFDKMMKKVGALEREIKNEEKKEKKGRKIDKKPIKKRLRLPRGGRAFRSLMTEINKEVKESIKPKEVKDAERKRKEEERQKLENTRKNREKYMNIMHKVNGELKEAKEAAKRNRKKKKAERDPVEYIG